MPNDSSLFHAEVSLYAGLANGVLLRTEVDRVTGQLEDTRTRFLGTRPPKLFAIYVRCRNLSSPMLGDQSPRSQAMELLHSIGSLSSLPFLLLMW